MSKESFSQSIYSTLQRKIEILEYRDPIYFFESDEDFKLALCIAYLTLSKEKIINKEIQNNDRLGRLTKMVATTDIDAIFDPSFNPEMPTITSTLESNNLWILDNFRDSIMHGAFDVDMKNKCFIINNTKDDRLLQATIPFSWFIAYTKNDIFNKKILDKYVVRGFFYNSYKKNRREFNTHNEINHHILYEAVITGNKFNVNEIEKRIRELFEEYKYDIIDEDTFNKYQTKLPRTKNQYNTKYLTTFAVTCDKVKEKLKEEYPDLNIKIFVKDKKHKISKRLKRKMDGSYINYDTLMETLNSLISSRSKTELNYIANIINHLTPVTDEQVKKLKEPNAMLLFNQLLEGKNFNYTSYQDIRKRYERNLEQARIICLTALVISTLVINQESVYNKYYAGHGPQQYSIIARTKQPLKDNLEKIRSTHIELLQKRAQLESKCNELLGCTSENGKRTLTATITTLEATIQQLEIDFDTLRREKELHKEYTNIASVERTKRELELIGLKLNNQIDNYSAATNKKDRKKILSSIKALYKDYIAAEEKDAFWRVDTMEETLTIIRNCFSHLERIYLGPDRKKYTTVILSDYDNSGNKSGEIITTYGHLLYMLLRPLEDQYILKKSL